MNDEQHPETAPETASPPEPRIDDPFIGIAADLADLGRTWARHGLGIGQQALVHAARTLELTASTLARVSDRLRPPS